jgi:hypothetical protein
LLVQVLLEWGVWKTKPLYLPLAMQFGPSLNSLPCWLLQANSGGQCIPAFSCRVIFKGTSPLLNCCTSLGNVYPTFCLLFYVALLLLLLLLPAAM